MKKTQKEMKFVKEVDSDLDKAIKAKFAKWGAKGGRMKTPAQTESRKRLMAEIHERRRAKKKKKK